jgi:galactoside O-acetyltransferase
MRDDHLTYGVFKMRWVSRAVQRLLCRFLRPTVQWAKSADVACWRVHGARSNQLVVGANARVRIAIHFERTGGKVTIGERTFLGSGVISIADAVEIGDDVMVAWGVTIMDHDSHSLDFNFRKHDVEQWASGRKNWAGVAVRPVRIRNKAWIGVNAIILKGVDIGEGAVVGAGAVVTSNVPAWTMVAGNPARKVKRLDCHG